MLDVCWTPTAISSRAGDTPNRARVARSFRPFHRGHCSSKSGSSLVSMLAMWKLTAGRVSGFLTTWVGPSGQRRVSRRSVSQKTRRACDRLSRPIGADSSRLRVSVSQASPAASLRWVIQRATASRSSSAVAPTLAPKRPRTMFSDSLRCAAFASCVILDRSPDSSYRSLVRFFRQRHSQATNSRQGSRRSVAQLILVRLRPECLHLVRHLLSDLEKQGGLLA